MLANAYHFAGKPKESMHEREEAYRAMGDIESAQTIQRLFEKGGEIAAAMYPKGVPVARKFQPAGTVTAQVSTASGGALVLVSVPSSGAAAPLAGQVEQFAHALAPRF